MSFRRPQRDEQGALCTCGAAACIEPIGYPDGSASLFSCAALIYAHRVRGQPLIAAHAQAAAHEAETTQFRLFAPAV